MIYVWTGAQLHIFMGFELSKCPSNTSHSFAPVLHLLVQQLLLLGLPRLCLLVHLARCPFPLSIKSHATQMVALLNQRVCCLISPAAFTPCHRWFRPDWRQFAMCLANAFPSTLMTDAQTRRMKLQTNLA